MTGALGATSASIILVINIVCLPPIVIVVVVFVRVKLDRQVQNVLCLEEEVDQNAYEYNVSCEV